MPRMKNKDKTSCNFDNIDVNINYFANKSIPHNIRKLKKPKKHKLSELTGVNWEKLDDDDKFNIGEEIDVNGTKKPRKKTLQAIQTELEIENQLANEYPEIIFYLISRFIQPEDVGNFARINRNTYSITKRESFWRRLYSKHCSYRPGLPDRLRIENSYKVYGLKQHVVRALYHTHKVFKHRIARLNTLDSEPHKLVKRRCVSCWYTKGVSCWYVLFKLKKNSDQNVTANKRALIDILEDIEANSEVDTQVLQIGCSSFNDIRPVMGMILSSVSIVLAQGFQHHRVHLGFNYGYHNVPTKVNPECTIVLDTVMNIAVFDWWHPSYPHFEMKLPSNQDYIDEDKNLTLLEEDFADMDI